MLELPAVARLDLWQAAEGRDSIERSLLLAAAGGGGEGDLARLPVGRRDEHVLALHRALGGATLEATARCPECDEPAEFAVEADALVARAGDAAATAELEVGDFVVAWRSPDSSDVAAAAAAGDAAGAERVLLGRCVTGASGPDGDVDATSLL